MKLKVHLTANYINNLNTMESFNAIKFEFILLVFIIYQVSVTCVDWRHGVSSYSVTPCSNLTSLLQNFLQFFVHVKIEEGDAEGWDDPEQSLQNDGEESPAERHGDRRRLIGPTIRLKILKSHFNRNRCWQQSS